MIVTGKLLEELGFEKGEEENQWIKIPLDVKGFCVRWVEELSNYYIEPIFSPTVRIRVFTLEKLRAAYHVITDRHL